MSFGANLFARDAPRRESNLKLRFINLAYLCINLLLPSFIDFEEDKTLIWDLTLPDDLVEGSARAWVTAVGDLMGPTLQVRPHYRALNQFNEKSLHRFTGTIGTGATADGLWRAEHGAVHSQHLRRPVLGVNESTD